MFSLCTDSHTSSWVSLPLTLNGEAQDTHLDCDSSFSLFVFWWESLLILNLNFLQTVQQQRRRRNKYDGGEERGGEGRGWGDPPVSLPAQLTGGDDGKSCHHSPPPHPSLPSFLPLDRPPRPHGRAGKQQRLSESTHAREHARARARTHRWDCR
jgi:hypothetical protein